MCEEHNTSTVPPVPRDEGEDTAAKEEEVTLPPPEEAKVFIKAGPVPIYFNANDVTIEREKKLLEQYVCIDGKPADGIGLECVQGGLGIAYWRNEPTEKDPKAGHWEHHYNLFPGQLNDFHECFRLFDRMCAMQTDLKRHAKSLEAQGKNGLGMMLNDKFRRQFTQISRMQLKINDTFRKVWFRKDKRP